MKKYLLLPVFLFSAFLSNSQEMIDPYHHPEQVKQLNIQNIDFSYLSTQNAYSGSLENLGYKVKDIFLKGKKSPSANEDGIILTPYFVAVIDGATSKSAFSMEGKTSGRLSMELVLEAINEFPKDIDASEAVRLITKKLYDFYVKNNLLESVNNNPAARLTSNGVIYSIARKELWQIGDCQALIKGKHYNNNKDIDDIMADARAAYDEVALLQGETLESLRIKDPGRDFILPFLKIQGVLQNYHGHPYGFPVMDGFEIDMNQVIVVPIEADEIILASDGYPNLFDTLKESEFFLKKVINEDPMLIRLFKSTKGVQKGQDSFDDRAYVRVKFE
ncbi:hypothetical protein [Dysgonomonas capnocytophagoides]|uniref:hypothetical protein n=1 Tax=Dysgonomonas capnocytophagoides TaxID=45254 RepID=UPI00333F702B